MALVVVLLIGGSIVRVKILDNPANFAKLPIPGQNTDDWSVYESSRHGYTIRYPQGYLLTEGQSGSIALKQPGAATEDPRSVGKRIGLSIYRLPSRTTLIAGGRKLDLRNASTLDELERQLAGPESTTTGQGFIIRRHFDEREALVCVLRESGENSFMTGGIYEVYILGEHEMERDERVLAVMSNNAGGTPHTHDRSLRRDMLNIFNTLHWK
jgi:hypothetical protein